MPTSKPKSPLGSQGGSGTPTGTPSAPSSYARFIPREELGSFSAWNPAALEAPKAPAQPDLVGGVRKPTLAERAAAEVRPPMRSSTAHHAAQAMGAKVPQQDPAAQPKPAVRRPIVGGVPGQAEAEAAAAEAAARAAAEPPPPPPPNVDELVAEARNTGYQDGYRNGLAALESYKQTQAAQLAAHMSEQVAALANEFQLRLESLEQQLAGRIAGVALELARQVVRSELLQRPELVVDVAEQALSALLTSARQIVLRLHPDDHAMVQAQLAELLAARGARVVGDPTITRGGCVVESDIAVVDASIEASWERAAAAMGHDAPWNGGHEAHGSTAVVRDPAELQDDEDGWPEGGV